MFSMKPAPDQQINAINGIVSLYQWSHITIISTPPSRTFVSKLTQRIQQSNKKLQVNIIEFTNETEITALLNDFKKSHTSVVILDCPITMVEHFMLMAKDMGLMNGDRAWIVTESITEASSGIISRLPGGLIGIQLRRSCDSAMSTSSQDMLYDALMVYAHAHKTFKDRGMSPSNRSSCYGDINSSSVMENTAFFR